MQRRYIGFRIESSHRISNRIIKNIHQERTLLVLVNSNPNTVYSHYWADASNVLDDLTTFQKLLSSHLNVLGIMMKLVIKPPTLLLWAALQMDALLRIYSTEVDAWGITITIPPIPWIH